MIAPTAATASPLCTIASPVRVMAMPHNGIIFFLHFLYVILFFLSE